MISDSKMKLLVLLGAIVLVRATPVPENCNGVRFTNSPVVHERVVLKAGVTQPFNLAVDRHSNTLYFSYSSAEIGKSTTAKVNLNNKEFKNIDSVPNGFAQAIDSTNNEVYIGSEHGIYKYDPETDTAELYAANNSNIWSLYYHNNELYYTITPEQSLHVVRNGESTKVKGIEQRKVDFIVFDKDDDVFYSNNDGIYGQKKGTEEAELFKTFDDASLRGLTTDKNGVVYASMFDGIYVVNKGSTKFTKIVELHEAYGVAFDNNNNVIYSDEHGVYLLKPNDKLTC